MNRHRCECSICTERGEEIERLQEAKRRFSENADRSAKEANGLRQNEADLRCEAGMYQSLYELSESKLARARKALGEVETRLEGPFDAQLYDIGLIVRAALTDEQRDPMHPEQKRIADELNARQALSPPKGK